jgi:hypothetical protein
MDFEDFLNRGWRAFELPAQLDLRPLWDGLADLCQGSLGVPPGGPLPRPWCVGGWVEWGACLVHNGRGTLLDHYAQGWDLGVNPLPACVPDGHPPPDYAGYAHTHLPLANGRTYPGFSALDYRASLADGDHLALVCNGPEVFALARTQDATQPRRVAGEEEFQQWQGTYEECLAQARAARGSRGGDPLVRGLGQANLDMCRLLGFAFYAGAWGQPLHLIYRPQPRR